jgi:hypothetical protein
MFRLPRIDVLLRPGEVRIARRRALVPGHEPGVQIHPVTAAQAGEPEAQGRWRASVDALDAALAGSGRSGSLHVVVSDHFLRYTLVPWNENLVADAERLAFARLAFTEIYGSMVDGWSTVLDQQPAGKASFACAMDRDLLQALRDVASRRGLRLRSVRAALGDRIRRHRRALRERVFCLASLEPGRLTCAFHDASGWIAVRTRRVEGSFSEWLGGALKQEAAAAGAADGGRLYLVADDLAQIGSYSSPAWQVTRLSDGVEPRLLLRHGDGHGGHGGNEDVSRRVAA